MRTKLETPLLLIGAAATGAALALLLDGEKGRRRRESLTETLSSLPSLAGDGLSSLTESVSSHLPGNGSRGGSWGGRSSRSSAGEYVNRAGQAVASGASSVASGASSVASGAGTAASAAGSSIASLFGSLLGSVTRRKTRYERLQEALSDAYHGVGSRLSRGASKLSWGEVDREVDRDDDESGESRTGSILTGSSALLLLGGAAYLLAFSPGAEDRRKRWGSRVQKTLGDVGHLASAAGRRVAAGGGSSGERRPGPTGPYQGEQTREQSKPEKHPAYLHGQIEDAIARAGADKSEVTVLIRDGVIVLQGRADPAEYQAIVTAVDGVTHTYVNELRTEVPA